MHIARRFTTAGRDPYDTVPFRTAISEIRNPDGSVVFQAEGIEVPAEWSQVACDILAQKYFRKAGVPARLAPVAEDGVPAWLWRRMPDAAALTVLPEANVTAARPMPARCSTGWPAPGPIGAGRAAISTPKRTPRAFYDEIRLMLARQMGAPNSPQWFNTGLFWAYGIDGPAQGHYYVDYRSGELCASASAYEHPQPHACFIQSVADDLVNEGGIMDLWVREARIFKYGSGSGSNFSKLRGDGERLSGGGRSSGLMSFLRIGDRAAGAIKSGGTTRRAAKMVIVDIDHPDIEAFIDWKVVEEQKVAALVAGSKLAARHLNRVMAACHGAAADRADSVRPGAEPGVEARDPRRPPRDDPSKLHPAGDPVRPSRLYRDRLPHLRHRLGFRGLPDRRRAEFEQFGPGLERFSRTGRRRRPLGTDPAHRRQDRQDLAGARVVGPRSGTPPGPRPIPACNSTRRSTTGTPAPKAAGSTPRTRARNTISSTTPRATSPRSI